MNNNFTYVDGGAAAQPQQTTNSLQKKINADIDRMVDISLFKSEEISVLIKNTVDIKCKVCGSDNVNVIAKQVRSSDEATSKFYTCLACGNRWRVD